MRCARIGSDNRDQLAPVSKDDVASSKPAGDIFAAALAQVFPMAASETLAIGDTPYDVEAALRSDIKTIGLRSGGFSGDRLAEAGAPYIYASVKELFAVPTMSAFAMAVASALSMVSLIALHVLDKNTEVSEMDNFMSTLT